MAAISFARGVPSSDCFPIAELAECAKAIVERDRRAVLSYGPSGGYRPLREWIGERHGVGPERVLVTNGSLQAFSVFATRLAGRGRVLVEAPTYDRSLTILHQLGAQVVDVPLDDDGLDVDALERTLAEGPAAAFLYTIPTFQNQAAERSRWSAGGGSQRSRARAACSSTRTIRTGSCASRVTRCRRSSSSREATASCTRPRSRRRSRRGPGSATPSSRRSS